MHSQNPPCAPVFVQTTSFGSLVRRSLIISGVRTTTSSTAMTQALAHSCCTHNVLLLHPSQGNPQNNLLLRFRNVVLGHGGASSKAMECHYLLCNLWTLHCSGAVPPVVAPHDIPKEDTGVRRQVHTKCGCLYKYRRME